MRPRRVLPPELYCPGTRPSQAANWRLLLNSRALPTVATMAVAVTSPMPANLHELLRRCAVPGHRLYMHVILPDPLVEVAHLGEQILDDGLAVAGQGVHVPGGLAAHDLGLLRQNDSELGPQAADTVKERGSGFNVALACAVHHEAGLLLGGLDRHEAHVRPLHRLADRRSVGGVGLAALAAHAVWRHELRRHELDGVTELREEPRPVMRTRAG